MIVNFTMSKVDRDHFASVYLPYFNMGVYGGGGFTFLTARDDTKRP